MDSPEKLATLGTQDEENQTQHSLCVNLNMQIIIKYIVFEDLYFSLFSAIVTLALDIFSLCY